LHRLADDTPGESNPFAVGARFEGAIEHIGSVPGRMRDDKTRIDLPASILSSSGIV
jgi:hypothetical protein